MRAGLSGTTDDLAVPDGSTVKLSESKKNVHTFAPSPLSMSTKSPPESSPSSVRTSTNIVHDLSTFNEDGFVADDATAVMPEWETCARTSGPFENALGALREPAASKPPLERSPLLVPCELDGGRMTVVDLELPGVGVEGRTASVCWRN